MASRVSPPQLNAFGSYTIELPVEFTTLRERGSIFQTEPLMKYLYSWFARAVEMSPDHNPELPSFSRKFAVVFQLLKIPGTDTEVASGAHTLNVTPVPEASAYGVEPIPGRLDCAGASSARTKMPAIIQIEARTNGRNIAGILPVPGRKIHCTFMRLAPAWLSGFPGRNRQSEIKTSTRYSATLHCNDRAFV